MKRSEWLKLASLVTQFRDSSASSSYNYDDYSSGKDEGQTWAYESAADDLEHTMRDFVVTEEDAVVCSSDYVEGVYGRVKHIHAAGSRPAWTSLGRKLGCDVCTEYAEATKA